MAKRTKKSENSQEQDNREFFLALDMLEKERGIPQKYMIEKIAQDPGDGEYALDLLMISKYFERIGDHATNIAEWVIFSVTGEHKEG